MSRAKTVCLFTAAALLCSGYFPQAASAQRLIVITQAWSAVREAAAVYAQSLDLQAPAMLPGAVRLPGRELLSEPVQDGKHLFITTGSRGLGSSEAPAKGTWHSAVAVAPFHLTDNAALPAPEQLLSRVALAVDQEAPAPGELLILGDTLEGSGGAILLYSEDGDILRRLELPGPPIAAVDLRDREAAVLCDSADGAQLLRCDLQVGRMVPIWSEQRPPDALDSTPIALAASTGNQFLFVMTTGYGVSQGLTQPQSWIHVISLKDTAPLDPPIAVPGGAAATSTGLQASGPDTVWALTTLPGTAFAQATQVRATGGVAVVQRAHSLPDAGSHPLIAPSPGDLATAAALGRRLEIWPLGARTGTSHEYPSPIQFLAWHPVGLFAASANQLYLVNPKTGAPEKSWEFQSGTIATLSVVPPGVYPPDDIDADGLSGIQEQRLGTAPDNPDSDGDGIHDGIDPEPLTPSPRLELPPSIVFRGDSAGRELRGLLLQPQHGEDSVWQVHYDTANLPWLNLRPITGQGWSPVFMGIDPARYAASGAAGGWLQVSMQGTRAPFPAAGSPQSILVSATPAPAGPPRILWIWDTPAESDLRDPADPRGFKALADLLAGPPHYFIHHELAGPIQDTLAPYNIVVLQAAAAARGALTRQALLDYVAAGGALLFLGAALPSAESRPLVNWLQPAGLHIYTDQPLSGVLPASPGPLTAWWKGIHIAAGCTLEADDPAYVRVPATGENTGALLARDYGYGRIALLAAEDPLRSQALNESPPRLFVQDLFQWLVRAGYDVSDMDNDGLPDSLEDPNNNGQFDPGETNYLLADTDEDGIPDGMEDINRNGALDEGETDPRNRDTDSDGVFDGADRSPVPIVGAPYLQRIDPAKGPAEGGNLVVLTGRNFVPGMQVFFGDRPSASLRYVSSSIVLAEAPGHADAQGGTVPVRVLVAGADASAELADAYAYTPRTKARLWLTNAEEPRPEADEYRGIVSVAWEASEPVAVKQIFLMLQAQPPDGFQWLEVVPLSEDAAAPDPIARPLENAALIAVVVPGQAAPRLQSGELFRAPWHCVPLQAPRQVTINIERASVQLLSGELLEVETEPLVLHMESGPTTAPRRDVR